MKIFIIILVCGFSFFFTIFCGSRGFFAIDQSIIFDSGYRILSGQVPYKDFLIPFGPVACGIQTIFFKIFGINFTAYLIHAALFNLLFVLCAFILLKRMVQDYVAIYIGCILTSILFYPQFGTPWFEQTAFFFSLLSLLLLTLSIDGKHNLAYFAGAAQSLAFLSKQNAGFLFLILLLIIGFRKEVFFKLVVGFLIGIMMFLVWAVLFSDVETLYSVFVKIPGGLGPERIKLLLKPERIKWIFFGSGLMVMALLISLIGIVRKLSLILIGLIIFHYLFAFITDNQPQNSLPFLGIVAAIAIDGVENKNYFKLVFLIIVGVTFLFGVHSAVMRDVQDVFKKTDKYEVINIPELRYLRWGRPTSIWGHEVKKEDVENLYRFLKSEKKSFFIFPDFTIFYGLLRVEPPQPLVFFDKGLTYPHIYSGELDQRITASLKKKYVEIVVIERISYFGTRSRLLDFPIMVTFIRNNFTKTESIGIFDIFRRIERKESNDQEG